MSFKIVAVGKIDGEHIGRTGGNFTYQCTYAGQGTTVWRAHVYRDGAHRCERTGTLFSGGQFRRGFELAAAVAADVEAMIDAELEGAAR